MIKAHAKLKAWGNSVGVIIPKDTLVRENLEAEDKVIITVKKETPSLKHLFGKLKDFKPTTEKSKDQILREMKSDFDSRIG